MPSLILSAIVFAFIKITVFGSSDVDKYDSCENVPLIRFFEEFKEELSSVISKHKASKESDINKTETNTKEVLLMKQRGLTTDKMNIQVILNAFSGFIKFIEDIFFEGICINNPDQSDENHKVANRIKEYCNQKIMDSNKYDEFFLGQYKELGNDYKNFIFKKGESNNEIYDDIVRIREKLKNLVSRIKSIKDSSNACI